jgi:hypothetical protein
MDDIKPIIDQMIALNLARRPQYNKYRDSLNYDQFIGEFGSVHFDIGRWVGKSTYIVQALRSIPNSCAIVYYERMRRIIWDLAKERLRFVFTNHGIQYGQWNRCRTKIDIVFIDEPAMFTHKELRFIYNSLEQPQDQVFVHLGIPRFN